MKIYKKENGNIAFDLSDEEVKEIGSRRMMYIDELKESFMDIMSRVFDEYVMEKMFPKED